MIKTSVIIFQGKDIFSTPEVGLDGISVFKYPLIQLSDKCFDKIRQQ